MTEMRKKMRGKIMNNKKAKALRKKIYGDLSLRAKQVRKQINDGGTIRNVGLRKDYQESKKK